MWEKEALEKRRDREGEEGVSVSGVERKRQRHRQRLTRHL